MIDERRLKQEYKKMQEQAAPDLWDRIESELWPIDREEHLIKEIPQVQEARKSYRRYGFLAAAAVFCVVVAGRLTVVSERSLSSTVATAAMAAETAGMQVSESQPQLAAEVQPTEDGQGVTLLSAKSLAVPEDAETVSFDARYFSEDILKETDLLCGAAITDVSFAYDDSGKAIHVIYEMTISNVYYAEDYVAQMDEISVSSPIIKTDGDEAYLLYQMQIGQTYLLPLKEQQDGWELLYPFAPQIQVMGEQDFLFHSGYTSLITEQAIVVAGEQEGENDFYYDRMLLRKDNAFLSELISLVK